MDQENDIFRKEREQWRIAPPPPDLAERIARRAVSLPQHRPWAHAWRQEMEAAFSNWRYRFAYKLAGLAVCALLGFMSAEKPSATVDISALALGGGAMEGI